MNKKENKLENSMFPVGILDMLRYGYIQAGSKQFKNH